MSADIELLDGAVPLVRNDQPWQWFVNFSDDAAELDVANHWQAVDLANKNLAAALGRLVEDRRKLKEDMEALRQPKVSEAPK